VELALHVSFHLMQDNASPDLRLSAGSGSSQAIETPVVASRGDNPGRELARVSPPVRLPGTFYRHTAAIAVLLLVFTVFAYRISNFDVASEYTDPISKVRAQDESVYVNSATRVVRDGDWLTPRFLDRFLLYKPPLLIWLTSVSIKLFGQSLFAFRFPAMMAAALATLLLFTWLRRSHSSHAAWTCALLLAANPLWYLFARLCYTDMIFAAATAGAIFVVRWDPVLARSRSRLLFAVCCSAGILAKNIAGFLPCVIWIAFCAVRGANSRKLLRTVFQTGCLILVFAAPWHLYQAAIHPQWFWADYVEVQLLGFGLRPPVQSSAEPQLWFYWKRLFLTDPILIAMVALALPALWKRRQSADALLAVCWLAVMTFALAMFGYRNLPYALNLIAPLALIASLYSYGGRWRVPLLAIVLVVRLSLHTTTPIPAAEALRSYAERGRPHELIIVSPDDEFYSATLDLPHVRYAFVDRDGVVERYARHLAWLGITMPAAQFADPDRWLPIYAQRLEDWGLKTTKPLATAIVARSEEEAIRLTLNKRDSDFFLPQTLLSKLPPQTWTTHSVVPAGNGRVFLFSKAHEVNDGVY